MRKVLTVFLSIMVCNLVTAQTPSGSVFTRQKEMAAKSDTKTARFGLGVNAGDALMFGTIGVTAQMALHQHWSIEGWFKYNNWSWNNDVAEKRLRQAQRSAALGARYWFWSSYSGWWLGLKGQWQEYSRGGVFGQNYKEEGDAYGAAVSGGYSVMLDRHWNIDFGIGGWTGYKKYVVYEADGESCPTCGRKTGEGGKGFILPNEFLITVMYVF